MKKILFSLIVFTAFNPLCSQVVDYNLYPVYTRNDLGLRYQEAVTGSSKSIADFRLWAPHAEKVRLRFYEKGEGGDHFKEIQMDPSSGGTWSARAYGTWPGMFYTFSVFRNNKWYDEVPDPYAKATGINGKRAAIVNLPRTNPLGWEKDRSPKFSFPTDAIIYELHVRDASIAANSGIKNKGKFAGLTELNTRNSHGLSTGLAHLKEMGITHVHLLPSYDYSSVDEKHPEKKYNWGYDPLNYNVPEGSYSTDPYNPITRIREFKQLIKTFHANGLRVVMDVVYNHTGQTESSLFNQLVPGYYYRQTKDGKFSNATACGNETASERPMVRKYIIESMKYWVQEYHIDGFRIDLMGVHDIETMNQLSKELHAIRPDILLYGEGWTAGSSALPDSLRALKANAWKLDRVAVFSDDIRDGIKGSVFEHADRGFASGKPGMEESIKFGVVASCKHPQVDYSKVNYSKKPYAAEPWHTISYCECHDNHVLWDKLALSATHAPESERKEMYKLAHSIVLSAQGIAFLHAGTEFLRSKKGVENSFESPDSINAIDWDLKTLNRDVVDYVRALVRMRREHAAFRMRRASDIAAAIRFRENLPPGLVAYGIDGSRVRDKWKKIFVCYNGSGKEQTIRLDPGTWNSFIRDNRIQPTWFTVKGDIILKPSSCSIFYIDQ
jgi:pullulanase